MEVEKTASTTLTYVVQAGDTLQGIALRHKMKVSDLKYLNHLFGGNIWTGQILQIEPRNRKRCHSEPKDREPEPKTDRSSMEGPKRSMPNLLLHQTNDLLLHQTDDLLLHQTNDLLLHQTNDIVDPHMLISSAPSSPRKRALECEEQVELESLGSPSLTRENSCQTLSKTSDGTDESSEGSPIKRISRSNSEYWSSSKNVLAFTPLPKLIGGTSAEVLDGSKMSSTLVQDIEESLPRHCRGYDWKLLYSLPQHGASISTFFRKSHKHSTTILVVENDKSEVFGCFTTKTWKLSHSYYGTGECFLFTSYPKFTSFPWNSSSNSMFMFSDENSLAIGGGGGFGLFLNSDFSQGSSQYCETFQNSCLASQEDFNVVSVELWELVTRR